MTPHKTHLPKHKTIQRINWLPFVKWSCYWTGVTQTVGRGIALIFHDRGTRRGWVVSSTPRPHFSPRKDPVPILLEAGWAPRPVWTGGKSRPHRDSILDHPARSQSLYRLSYPAHDFHVQSWIYGEMCKQNTFILQCNYKGTTFHKMN